MYVITIKDSNDFDQIQKLIETIAPVTWKPEAKHRMIGVNELTEEQIKQLETDARIESVKDFTPNLFSTGAMPPQNTAL